MLANKLGHRLDPYLHKIYQRLFGDRGNPNLLTLLGFLVTLVASFLVIQGFWILGALAIILSGAFDLFDGVTARNLGKVTPFGGFLDSVLDRYSDLILLLAFAVHYLIKGNARLVILTFIVSVGTALIPYARARAEAAQIQCNVGLMERAERVILLSAGTLFNWMEPVLWIMAVLTHYTVVDRIYYVWKRLNRP
jgi:CDP-diacylglycerol--glycerol-3-phosphate 3-phosphatidyltransferase